MFFQAQIVSNLTAQTSSGFQGVLLLRQGGEGEEGKGRREGKGKEREVGKGRKGKEMVGLLSTTKNNADISQPEQISKRSSKIVRFPKFMYT